MSDGILTRQEEERLRTFRDNLALENSSADSKTLATLALCSMKGGTGKTTLALNLAERAHASGLRVAVIDFDPQEGAIGLLDLRADQESAWPVFASRVNVAGAKSLASMKSGGEYDLLVCDLPGSDSMALGRLLMEMDLILSPVGVSAVEIMVAANFTSMVERLNLPVVFVPNNVSAGRARNEEMLQELATFADDVCPVAIQHRVAHLDATRLGLGVNEAFPKSIAAREIDSLWVWVAGRMNLDVRKEGNE